MNEQGITKPQIAVVIPCYHHANVLRRTLEGLVNQTIQPTEVVVVDDGSTDDPKPIVDAFVGTLPIQFIRFEQNRGAQAARNEGARRTSSPYLIFLDADAKLAPQALERFSSALETHPEADLAYSNLWWDSIPIRSKPFDVSELKKRNYIHTSSLLRRLAFPTFDETIKKLQDWDLWLTMTERGSKGIWIDEFLYRIDARKHKGAISRWLPSIIHRLPWPIFGWMPEEIKKYRIAEKIVREKHRI